MSYINITNSMDNIKFMRIPFGDRRSECFRIISRHPTELFTNQVNMQVTVCKNCGEFSYSNFAKEKNHCKCEDTWGFRCKEVYNNKLQKVLNELVEKRKSDEEDVSQFLLQPCPNWHEGDCTPDRRTCIYCWNYRCSICKGGVGGSHGKCYYNKCRSGRRSL